MLLLTKKFLTLSHFQAPDPPGRALLAPEASADPLKTPYRCDLKSKLVELLMGHILKAFRAKKIGPGWQGGSETNFGVGA